MEDDKNPFDQFDTPQTAPAAPSRPVLSVRPLGTGTKQPAPQTPTQVALDEQSLKNKQLEAQKLTADLAKAQKSPEEMAAAQEEILNVIRNAVKAKKMSQEGWGATGFGSDLVGMIPGTTGYALEHGPLSTIGANTAFDRLQRMRDQSQTGGALGSITENELALLRNSIASLDRGLPDTDFQENMDYIMKVYGDIYRRTGGDDRVLREAMGNLLPPSENKGVPGAIAGGGATPGGPTAGPGAPPGGGPDEQMDRSTRLLVDDTSPGKAELTTAPIKFATDQDKRIAAVVQTVLDRAGSVEEANKILDQYGYNSTPLDAEAWKNAVEYNKTRPKGAPKARVSVPQTGERDQTGFQKAVGNFAASPAGGATIGALNGITAGTIDEIGGGIDSLVSGKPLDQAIAEANLKKGLTREANPTAYGIGEVGGGVAGSLATGGLVSGGLQGAARTFGARAIAGDLAYGGMYGAGENNDDRLGGAATGALLSGAGGVVGRGALRGVAGAIAPEVNPFTRALRDRGVRLTPGQAIGPRAAAFEEKLSSVPIVGDMVKSARERSIGDFNAAVVNDALAPIGKALPKDADTTKAMKFAQDAFNEAYDDARSGMRLKVDAEMLSDLSALDAKAAGGAMDANSAARLRKVYKTHVADQIKKGNLSGDDYKTMVSTLGKIAEAARRKPNLMEPDFADGVHDLQSIIDNAARRSSPAEYVAKMDAADRGYALMIRAEKAAAARGGETGSFTPLQYDAAVQKADGSVRSKAYLRGEARGQELAEAGKQILRDRIPNSGTFDRAAVGVGIAGGGYMAPPALAGLAGIAAAYAPGLRTAIPAAMTRRSSPAAEAVANAIRERARLAGAAASPLLLAYSGGGQ